MTILDDYFGAVLEKAKEHNKSQLFCFFRKESGSIEQMIRVCLFKDANGHGDFKHWDIFNQDIEDKCKRHFMLNDLEFHDYEYYGSSLTGSI